jgi:NAD+ synthase (glutamine-hydrolysing)
MAGLGCHAETIDIRSSCRQMLADIGHPAAAGKAVYDVTYENVQAGERTSHLFRLANRHRALVVGTSDLSELALGWCTYGVGDQMSHDAANASVPKTLVQHVVGWVAESGRFGPETRDVLRDILATRISPESSGPLRCTTSPSTTRFVSGSPRPDRVSRVVGLARCRAGPLGRSRGAVPSSLRDR